MKAGWEAHRSGRRRESPALSVLLDVALVVDLHTDWHEALATLAAATGNDVTTSGGLHSGAETELTLPGALGGLIGSFGHNRVGCGKAV